MGFLFHPMRLLPLLGSLSMVTPLAPTPSPFNCCRWSFLWSFVGPFVWSTRRLFSCGVTSPKQLQLKRVHCSDRIQLGPGFLHNKADTLLYPRLCFAVITYWYRAKVSTHHTAKLWEHHPSFLEEEASVKQNTLLFPLPHIRSSQHSN